MQQERVLENFPLCEVNEILSFAPGVEEIRNMARHSGLSAKIYGIVTMSNGTNFDGVVLRSRKW